MVMMRNPRDIFQIPTLGKQIGAGKLLVEAYVDATSQAYGYIVLNLSPHRGDDDYIITSAIFPGEDLIVYLPL